MDLRSFRLNFEVHALVHDASLADRLEKGFADDVRSSRLVNLAEWRARPGIDRVLEGASRLVSPLL
jgi:cardiolipin synthase